MTERREFDCPQCGSKSWLDPATMAVEHSEPKCPAWLEMEARQATTAAVGVPHEPTSGVHALPDSVVEFACPECSANVRMYPQRKPLGVEHALPTCKLWQRIEEKKDDLPRYLIKAGVHIHVPEPESEQSSEPR